MLLSCPDAARRHPQIAHRLRNYPCRTLLNCMDKKNPELSTWAILGLSAAFAAVGLLAYGLLLPTTPAEIVAMEHAQIGALIR